LISNTPFAAEFWVSSSAGRTSIRYWGYSSAPPMAVMANSTTMGVAYAVASTPRNRSMNVHRPFAGAVVSTLSA
jgi:hypothetical protein